ncbi:hypothetical protein COO60DRAFT_1461584 [Scenedesmus sp. NREL 46B-D3]|nr:hypothetical protein COO60DRAFT_1461584 [Scenedesmus sp. NREL 46B-D3]
MTSLAVLLFVQLLLVGKLSASKGLPEVEQYAEHLAHQRLFAGMLHVEQGPCQQPQIQHLLRMSGGVMGTDNCAYKDDAWQQQYCMDSSTSPTSFNFTAYQAMQLGAASIAEYLQLIGVLRMPLEFRPGSSYHYSNPGYSIVGYIVEKPGQDAALADTSGASIQQLAASAGSPRYWAGDVPSNTSAAAAAATVAGKQAAANSSADGSIRVGMTAKYPGPSGFDWSLANAAGAIVSTPQDMAKWLRALLVGPDHLGLGKELLKEFLGLSTDVAGMPRLTVRSNGSFVNATLEFAQGLVVLKDAAHARGLGVSSVYYLGSLGGFQAAVYMWLDPRDPAKDVFINAAAATCPVPLLVSTPCTGSSSSCCSAASRAQLRCAGGNPRLTQPPVVQQLLWALPQHAAAAHKVARLAAHALLQRKLPTLAEVQHPALHRARGVAQ